MNFNINNLFHSQSENTVIQEENKLQSADAVTDGTNVLQNLSVGDIFNAKILDIRNLDVKILLSNYQEVYASIADALELNIGETIAFQIKSNGENGIVIRPVGNSQIPPELVTKSLTGAGITINDKNMAIVKELINNGQPIDKQSILNTMKIINNYKTESIDKLVQMMKHGIEINDDTLSQYDKYLNSEHKLLNTIDSLSDNLVNYLKNADTGELNLKINFLFGLSQAMEEDSYVQQPVLNETNVDAGMKNQESLLPIDNEKILTEQIILNDNNINMVTEGQKLEEGILTSVSKNIVESEPNTTYNNLAKVIQNEVFQSIASKIDAKTNQVPITYEEHTPKIIDYLSQTQSIQDVAKTLDFILKQGFPDHEIQKILDSPAFKKAIKFSLNEKVLLKISNELDETILEKKDINNLYERLVKVSNFIDSNLSKEDKQDNALLNNAKDIKNNVMFMNELNHIASYVQLPFKMNSRHEHGDLYVYGKKGKKQENNAGVTAFLHLDLEYLGATDIHVELVNHAVSTKFTLDNKISEKIVEDHLHELQKRLEKKGYTTKLTVETVIKYINKKETSDNVLNNIFEKDDNASTIKRYSFDIRA